MDFVYTLSSDHEEIEDVNEQINTKKDLKKPIVDGFVFDTDSLEMYEEKKRRGWDFSSIKSSLKPKSQYSTVDDKILKVKRSQKPLGKNEDEAFDNLEFEDFGNETDDELADADDEKEEDEAGKKASTSMEVDAGEDEIEADNSDVDENFASKFGDLSESEDDVDERKEAYFEDIKVKEKASSVSFQDLKLSRPIQKGIALLGYTFATKIQANTIPIALTGQDICANATTGSGKTAAFLIPIIERLLFRSKKVSATRVLIILPTRELAAQCFAVTEKLAQFTDITCALIVGGLNQKFQENELLGKPDIVIATPGRLIDHLQNCPSFHLDNIEILVLDEADRILEIGFKAELEEIVKYCPKSRQTMLFSATMTDNIDELIRLSLNHPARIFVSQNSSIAENLTQEFIRIRSHHEDDRPAILLAICKKLYNKKTIIFFPSKLLAHKMKIIFGLMGLSSSELHGSLTQAQRLEALEKFRDNQVDFLLATDLAARGIDISGIKTVINYSMPLHFKHYLHRVGRTARAGEAGKAVTLVGEADRNMLKQIVKISPKEAIQQRKLSQKNISHFSLVYKQCLPSLQEIIQEEKHEKAMMEAEMKIKKAENILTHADEIKSRPAKQWFQTVKEKKEAKGYENNKKKDAKDKSKTMTRKKRRALLAKEESSSLKFQKVAAKSIKKKNRPKSIKFK